MPGESILESKIARYAEDYGCYTRKFKSIHNGVPDRIISKELTLFLEVKDFGKRPTNLQKDEISTICATGGYATWVDNFAQGVELVDIILVNRPDWLRKYCSNLNYWL